MPRPADTIPLARLDAHFTEESRTVHTRHTKGDQETLWKRDFKCLGRGSFGEVYREECVEGPVRGTLRAVKLIQKPHSLGLQRIDFSRELEAIARFSLPAYERHFVKALGWYETPDTVFIAMEYLEHGDLQQYASHSLPEIEVHAIASQVLQGLSFMHSQGYAHRDLKPQNLLVHRPRPQWQIKIADFGLSKRVADDLSSLRTQAGTQGYIAPEVLGLLDDDDLEDDDSGNDSAPSYSNAVDIWALGVIAFYMLTNQLPFPALNLRPLKRYVRGKAPFPVEPLRKAKISDDGCAWIESCMTPSPSDRPGANSSLHETWRIDSTDSIDSGNADVDSRYSSVSFTSLASASWRAIDSVYGSADGQCTAADMQRLVVPSDPPATESLTVDADHEAEFSIGVVAAEAAISGQNMRSQIATSSNRSLSDNLTDLEPNKPIGAAPSPQDIKVKIKRETSEHLQAQFTTSSEVALTNDAKLDLQAQTAPDLSNMDVVSEMPDMNRDAPQTRELSDQKTGSSISIQHTALSVDSTTFGIIYSTSLKQSQIWLNIVSTDTGDSQKMYQLPIAANNLRPKNAFGSLVLGPTGSNVALLTKDASIYVWDMASEGTIHGPYTRIEYTGPEYDVYFDHLELSRDGKVLAHFRAAATRIYDLATMSLVRIFDIGRTTFGSRAMSPDGLYITTIHRTAQSHPCGSDRPHFQPIDSSHQQCHISLHIPPCTVSSHGHAAWPWWATPLFSSDGRRVCVVGTCNSRIYEFGPRRQVYHTTGFHARSAGTSEHFCGRPAFSADGKWLAWLSTPENTNFLVLTTHEIGTSMEGTLKLPKHAKWEGLGFCHDGALIVVGVVFSRQSSGLFEVVSPNLSRSEVEQIRTKVLLINEMDLYRTEPTDAVHEKVATGINSLPVKGMLKALAGDPKFSFRRQPNVLDPFSMATKPVLSTKIFEISESEANTCGLLEHMAVSVDHTVIGAVCPSSYTRGLPDKSTTTLHLWSTFTGKTLYKQDLSKVMADCDSHRRVYHHSLAIGPKASCVALINSDGALHVWSLKNDKISHRKIFLSQSFAVDNLWSGIWSRYCRLNDGPRVEFSTDGKFLAYHANETCIYDCRDMSLVHVVTVADIGKTPHGYRRISPDGRIIAYIRRGTSKSTLDKLQLWNLEMKCHQNSFASHEARYQEPENSEEFSCIEEIAAEAVWFAQPLFSQDGRRMCMASKADFRVWDVSSGQSFYVKGIDAGSLDFSNPSSNIAFSYDGRLIAALTVERQSYGPPCSRLTLCNVETGASVAHTLPVDLRCLRLVFRQDDVLLLIGYLQSIRTVAGDGPLKEFWLGEKRVAVEILLATPARDFGFLLDRKTSPTTDELRNRFIPTKETVDTVLQMIRGPTIHARPSAGAIKDVPPVSAARYTSPILQPTGTDDTNHWWGRFKEALLR